jgi:PHP family Zn ribbon phosphoesterase
MRVNVVTKKNNNNSMGWRTMDLHIHTPASSDYQQLDVSNLEILQRAEARGLDIIAFTDHNTMVGYRQMREEVEKLEFLEKLNRLEPGEKIRLDEYRRLFAKILVLPGFEFTATFGFHILGIFSPQKPIREIEHLLLNLRIDPNQLDEGAAAVGATSDVLTAYHLIHEAGGIVIAAHANSSNGVAMRGFSFGGQTKIAYTQDEHLHALEVTDLDQKGPRSTAAFFSGTKPEYPRRMHCIQGSDAHRLTMDPQRKKNLGVGDRATDVLISEVSFQALLELFQSNDFARTRPHRHQEEPVFDFIQSAREEGPNIVQDFHEAMTIRGGKLYGIIANICAFGNTNGGTLYIGLAGDPNKQPIGVPDIEQAVAQLEKEISKRISPPLACTFDTHELRGKRVIRVLIPRGDDPPYAVDDNKIYVRDEAETGLAVRDEIVGLVLRGSSRVRGKPVRSKDVDIPPEVPPVEISSQVVPESLTPRTGVEIVEVEERNGSRYYTMRDLRNGNVVKNVTPKSARRLWHYAIKAYEQLPADAKKANIHWQGDYGLLKKYKQGTQFRYDLVQRKGQNFRFYFGVTDDGVHGPWKMVTGID